MNLDTETLAFILGIANFIVLAFALFLISRPKKQAGVPPALTKDEINSAVLDAMIAFQDAQVTDTAVAKAESDILAVASERYQKAKDNGHHELTEDEVLANLGGTQEPPAAVAVAVPKVAKQRHQYTCLCGAGPFEISEMRGHLMKKENKQEKGRHGWTGRK